MKSRKRNWQLTESLPQQIARKSNSNNVYRPLTFHNRAPMIATDRQTDNGLKSHLHRSQLSFQSQLTGKPVVACMAVRNQLTTSTMGSIVRYHGWSSRRCTVFPLCSIACSLPPFSQDFYMNVKVPTMGTKHLFSKYFHEVCEKWRIRTMKKVTMAFK